MEHCVYKWSALINLASTIYRGADPVIVEVGNNVKRALCVFRQLPPVTPRVCPTVCVWVVFPKLVKLDVPGLCMTRTFTTDNKFESTDARTFRVLYE